MTPADNDPERLRSAAETLATEAAAFVRTRRAQVFGGATPTAADVKVVRTKSTPTDPVTVVDTETERLLRDRLAQLRPGIRSWVRKAAAPVAGRSRPPTPSPGCWIPSTAR